MRARGRALAVLGALVAGLAWNLASASPALAHAELASSEPSSSARLQEAPDRVTLRFTEAVSLDLGFLRVLDEDGDRVDNDDAGHGGGDQRTLTVGLRGALPDASYIVTYRVLSADSHPVEGAYSFVVGDGPLAAVPASADDTPSDPTVRTLFAVTRWVGFAGIALLIGGALFLVFCWPGGRAERRPRGLVWTGWGLVAGSTALALPLQGLYASGRGLGGITELDLLDATLHTNFGRMLSARLVLLAVLGLLLDHVLDPDATPDGERRWQVDAAGLVALATLGTWGASGHAAAGIQPPLAVLGDTVHLAAMSTWVGGLAILGACVLPMGAHRAGELAGVLPVFSRVALGCVATLVVTGVYQGWREVGTIPALWHTSYGQLLVAKVSAFTVLLCVGYLSRAVVQRRYVMPVAHALTSTDTAGSADPRPGDAARLMSRLRRSVGFEVLIAASVLAVTAVLIAQPPARATYSEPYDETLALGQGNTVQVEVDPATTGPNELHVYVFDTSGQALDPLDLTVEADAPSDEIGPTPVRLDDLGTGHFVGSELSLPQAGTWQLRISVRTSEFEESSVTARVPVS